jgi:hypothetical protein
MKEYFAKILVQNLQPKKTDQVVLSSFAEDEETAEMKIDNIIEKWENVDFYEILKISNKPIQLRKYLIFADLKYSNGNLRTLTIPVRAENESDADVFFHKLIKEWNHVVSVQLKNIEKQF